MSKRPKTPSTLLEPLFAPEVAAKEVAQPQTGQSITALWLADAPTWALERLHLEVDPILPVLAIQGERVVGSNYSARKAGIRPGETLSRALQISPTAQVFTHDAPAMMAAWDSAIATAYSYSPWVEPVSSSLMFVGGLNSLEAEELARKTNTRAGQAHSRSTAQLAALISREGQSKAISNETAFIAQIPVGYLLGLGFEEDMIERLKLLGMEHLADIHRLNLTQKQLEAQFRSEGKRLYQVAHGQFTQPVQRFKEPLIAQKHFEFEEPALEPFQFIPVLQLLVAQAAIELQNKVCWTVTVKLQYATSSRLNRRVLGTATNSPKALLNVAELTLWDAHKPGQEIEALEVILGRIVLPEATQQDLFGVFDRPPIQEAIERVDQRFNGGIGRVVLRKVARFKEDGWRFIPLGPSQQAQVGEGRRLR